MAQRDKRKRSTNKQNKTNKKLKNKQTIYFSNLQSTARRRSRTAAQRKRRRRSRASTWPKKGSSATNAWVFILLPFLQFFVMPDLYLLHFFVGFLLLLNEHLGFVLSCSVVLVLFCEKLWHQSNVHITSELIFFVVVIQSSLCSRLCPSEFG